MDNTTEYSTYLRRSFVFITFAPIYVILTHIIAEFVFHDCTVFLGAIILGVIVMALSISPVTAGVLQAKVEDLESRGKLK